MHNESYNQNYNTKVNKNNNINTNENERTMETIYILSVNHYEPMTAVNEALEDASFPTPLAKEEWRWEGATEVIYYFEDECDRTQLIAELWRLLNPDYFTYREREEPVEEEGEFFDASVLCEK